MRRTCCLLALPVLVLGLACSNSDNAPPDDIDPPPSGNTVSVRNNTFMPNALTISAGDSVHFVWASGSTLHDVVPLPANTEALPRSASAPFLRDAPYDFWATFPTAGAFGFFCSAHGGTGASGMIGTITVE